SLDFIGVNYYSRQLFRLEEGRVVALVPPAAELSDLGKETWPQGLYDSLQFLSGFGLPLIVTEKRVTDADDRFRESYIRVHLAVLSRFMRDRPDVPVLGYLAWALTDNFEWENGFRPRFGLYAVDYATQERTLRPSAAAYAKIVADCRAVTASQP